MECEGEISKGVEEFLKLDHNYFTLNISGFKEDLMNFDFSYYFNMDDFGTDNFKRIVYFCVLNKKFKYGINFYESQLSIYCELNSDIDLKNIGEVGRQDTFTLLYNQIKNKEVVLFDGNDKQINNSEFSKIIDLFEAIDSKQDSKFLKFAENYKGEKHIYNNIIVQTIFHHELTSLIDNLTITEKDIINKIKKEPRKIYEFYYNYEFLKFDTPIRYSGGHPFDYFVKGMFDSIIEGIKRIDISKISKIPSDAHNLKVICEIFENSSLKDIIKIDIGLWNKLDYVVNFSRWLYAFGLSNYYQKEYYLTEELEKELIDYVIFIRDYLINAISDLINYDLYEDRVNVFESKLRYIDFKEFDFKKITDKIDKDYNNTKEIKDICLRRNKSILWEDEGGPNDGSKEKQFEDFLHTKLKLSYAKVQRNKRLLDQTGTDFLASDGKNTLVLIEAKTGMNAAKPNNIKKLFLIISALKIESSFYIINEDVTNPDSINTAKDFCQISNIQFVQTNSNDDDFKVAER